MSAERVSHLIKAQLRFVALSDLFVQFQPRWCQCRQRWRARIVLTCTLLGVVLAIGLPRAQQLPPGDATGTGAISGVVTDGVAKRPLAEATVVLTSVTSGRLHSSTLTDSEGRFVFRDVPAGASYVLRAGKPGYADGSLAQREARSSTLSSLAPVTIGKGEVVPNANITMWPLGTIRGTVVDERGEPVVNVRVRVLLRTAVAGALHSVAGPIANTDDRGFYEISGLSEGSYFVGVMSVQATLPSSISQSALTGDRSGLISAFASAEDVGPWRLLVGNYPVPPPSVTGRRQVYPALFHPNARSLGDAAPVGVAPGQQRTGVDFVLRPVPAVTVSGQLTGPRDAVAGRLLRLLPEGSEELGAGSEQATTIAGPNGEFSFLNVPSGTYILETRSAVSEFTLAMASATSARGPAPTPGFVPHSGASQPISARQGINFVTRISTRNDQYGGRLQLTVTSEDLSGVTVPVRSLATINGRFVCDEGLPGPCHDYPAAEPATGDPTLAPAAQSGSAAERQAALAALGLVSRSAPAAAPGTFSIAGLQEGQYFIRLPDRSVAIKSVVVGGIDHTYHPITVSSADINDVVVTLTSRSASLSGRVRDARGVDMIEGAVVVFPTETTQWTRFGFNPPRIRIVPFFGATGYRLTGLPAGDYYVIAGDVSLADVWQDPRFFPVAAAAGTRVSLNWGAAATLDLTSREVTIK